MTVGPHQLKQPAEAEPSEVHAYGLGVPGANGRWQPTRAGAVNSWAWADETFLFADGWLALAGPNGSGKSLTASMLITLLLDADSSQKSLSVSGDAVGTLTDRHTDRNPREDRTGAWWLEYGRRDPHTGQVSYMTTGLWLRSAGGVLHRAFFLTPARVGAGLLLQQDRNPVSIDTLAEQLAKATGQLFTASDTLRAKAGKYLPVADEASYRAEIRTSLFAPLDDVQFDALVSVLRSLRSVRTAEAISPKKMCEVLTEALPALDPDRLAVVAEAMERISDVENNLKRTKEETRLLERTEELYRRYVAAVAAAEAAILSAADGRFDRTTREARKAEQELEATNGRVAAANSRRGVLRGEIALVDGQLSAVDSQLRDHAGAELPQLEQRLHELRAQYTRDTERVTAARNTADHAARQAIDSAADAHRSQTHLAELGAELQAAGTRIGASAALERLVETGAGLAAAARTVLDSDRGIGIELNAAQVASTPLGWTEMRTGQAHQVDGALRAHALAQQDERSAASELRRAEEEQDRREGQARDAANTRHDAEADLLAELDRWEATRVELPAVPRELTAEAEDRLDPEPLTGWLRSAADETRARIGVFGHQQAAAEAAVRAENAANTAAHAAGTRDRADGAAETANAALHAERAQAANDRAAAEVRREQAHIRHVDAEAVAVRITEQAEAELEAGRTAATQAAQAWAHQVTEWRTSLVHLSADAVTVPDDPDAVDPHAAQVQLERAHAASSAALQVQIADTDRHISNAATTLTDLTEKLTDARRAAPVPTAPPWRHERDGTAGVPLWALVDFAADVPKDAADRLEGALLLAGLLDALVAPDGSIAAGDVTLTPGSPAAGRTLADLLTVEADARIDRERVTALLRSIAVAGPGGDLASGHLRTGVITTTAPHGYHAVFIGRTARERARLARVADLETQIIGAEAALDELTRQRTALGNDVVTAAAERDSFPTPHAVDGARSRVAELRLALGAAQRATAEHLAAALFELHAALTGIATEKTAIEARVAEAVRQAEHAAVAAVAAQLAVDEAEQVLADEQRKAAEKLARKEQAEEAQRRCDAETQRFPVRMLETLREALRDEDLAEQLLTGARAATAGASGRHQQASSKVRDAVRAVNAAATLPDGAMLPTAPAALQTFLNAVDALNRDIHTWQHAAGRAADLLKRAREQAMAAAGASTAAETAAGDAERARVAADRLQAQVDHARELYGAEYDQLSAERNTLQELRAEQQTEDERLLDERQEASNAAARAQTTLDNLAPRRAEAERERDTCLQRMSLLVTHGFAAVPDAIPTDDAGRPANITAAITWSRRLLTDRPMSNDREEILSKNRSRALSALENSARTVNAALARFNQQLDIATLDGTDWRRVTLATPNAAVGEDLRQAVASLRATTDRLEADLRDDIKTTLKTAMFIQLRRDIQDRREMAQELVRQIRTTLAGVRTGVAQVGVEVDWVVREDSDARQMVNLIAAPPSDETFEHMYQVLRQRMEEADAEAWADRVGHTFDYRSWHDWKISVTHRSFSTDGLEKFRPVTARSNPLKSLSTGESRLATMLPLLAAAWSMYSGAGYTGPRLISIDEIDAAFDEPNLRRVLALLREWDFDVLATTPTMSPLIKREAQRVVVHQVVTTGSTRVTVPWLWQGTGEPQPLTLDLLIPDSR